MSKLIFLLITPAILLFACDSSEVICSDFPFAESSISNQEDYLIIEAIINDRFSQSDISHISQESLYSSDSTFFSYYFKVEALELEPEAIEEYTELSRTIHNWSNTFNTQQKLISKEELDCLFTNINWTRFYNKYPESGGYLKFGKPILINPNRALVTLDNLCNAECSSGQTVELIKENGEWTVKDLFVIWIS